MAQISFPNRSRIIGLQLGIEYPFQNSLQSIYTSSEQRVIHGAGFWTGNLTLEPKRYLTDVDESIELEQFISNTEGIGNEFDIPINYRVSRGQVDDGITLNVVSTILAGHQTIITFNETDSAAGTTSTPSDATVRSGDFFNITIGTGDSARTRLLQASADNIAGELRAVPAIRGITPGTEIVVTRFNAAGIPISNPILRAHRVGEGIGLLSYNAGNVGSLRIDFRERT